MWDTDFKNFTFRMETTRTKHGGGGGRPTIAWQNGRHELSTFRITDGRPRTFLENAWKLQIHLKPHFRHSKNKRGLWLWNQLEIKQNTT